MKRNLGSVLALYPTPATVVGAMVDGKPNWMLVAHVGILGHDRILISCAKAHVTNRGIRQTGAVSVHLVNEALLPKADFVGGVSGAKTDKSKVFDYDVGTTGAPIIRDAPLCMECTVDAVYETEGFDNFILKISNTYAEETALDENGKPDFEKISPVLFEMPEYSYLSAGKRIAKCLKMGKEQLL